MFVNQRAQILDAKRKFAYPNQASVLILFAGDGSELTRLAHGWHIKPPSRRSENADQHVITVIETGTALDSDMANVKAFRYELTGPPFTGDPPQPTVLLSDLYTHTGIDKPAAGKDRVWTVKTTLEKFRNEFFMGA